VARIDNISFEFSGPVLLFVANHHHGARLLYKGRGHAYLFANTDLSSTNDDTFRNNLIVAAIYSGNRQIYSGSA